MKQLAQFNAVKKKTAVKPRIPIQTHKVLLISYTANQELWPTQCPFDNTSYQIKRLLNVW